MTCMCPKCAPAKSPLSNLPGWARAEQLALEQFAEEYNAAVLRDNQAREQWGDTYGEGVGKGFG